MSLPYIKSCTIYTSTHSKRSHLVLGVLINDWKLILVLKFKCVLFLLCKLFSNLKFYDPSGKSSGIENISKVGNEKREEEKESKQKG